MRFRHLIAALLLLSPLPLGAQDSLHVKATKADLDSMARDKTAPSYSKRAQARMRAREDSLLKKPVPPPAPVPSRIAISAVSTTMRVGGAVQLGAVVQDSAGVTLPGYVINWASSLSTVATVNASGLVTGVGAGSVLVTASTPTALALSRAIQLTVTDTVVVPTPTPGIAELPRITPVPPYPACARTVTLALASDLKNAMNTSLAGDCLVLPRGGSFVGNFVIPNRSFTTGWVTVTTAGYVPTPGQRMTPSKAASMGLAKILSDNYTEALGTAPCAHGFIFRGVEIATTPAAQLGGMNSLVRWRDNVNGTCTPNNLWIQEAFVHGTATLDMRRCTWYDTENSGLVDSWVDDCHSNNSDSQALLGLNCTKGLLIRNNTLKAGHETVVFGGGDPKSAACSPQDVSLIRNHIYHPVGWYKVWQAKNCLETKNVSRYLITGNVIENCWADAQAGFTFVLKSENQDCTAPYSTTSDVTISYNLARNVSSGFNLSGTGSNGGQCANVPAARFNIHDNVFENFAPPAWGGDGIPVQFLSKFTDAQLVHNTFKNIGPGYSNQALSLDGAPAAIRLVFDANVIGAGAYGVKGGGCTAGTPCLTQYAPGFVFTNNVIVSKSGCSVYPLTNSCSTTLPAGSVVGADSAKVAQATAGVVVVDPLASLPRFPRGTQTGWKPTSAEAWDAGTRPSDRRRQGAAHK